MIYLVLPAYNEEVSFENLFRKTDEYFRNELNVEYKIVVCDDGSSYRTRVILVEYAKNYL